MGACGCREGDGAPSIATSEGSVSISLREHSLGPLDSAFERKFSPYDGNGGYVQGVGWGGVLSGDGTAGVTPTSHPIPAAGSQWPL